MKDKFLFAAFAALAMTACTSEEDMQVNPTAQTSPIQFTVSMDDAQTRAAWGVATIILYNGRLEIKCLYSMA